jgi:hypothetical protein
MLIIIGIPISCQTNCAGGHSQIPARSHLLPHLRTPVSVRRRGRSGSTWLQAVCRGRARMAGTGAIRQLERIQRTGRDPTIRCGESGGVDGSDWSAPTDSSTPKVRSRRHGRGCGDFESPPPLQRERRGHISWWSPWRRPRGESNPSGVCPSPSMGCGWDRFSRGIFSKEITPDALRHLRMTIPLKGVVAT